MTTLVTHLNPDDDALVALYVFAQLLPEQWDAADVALVPAGQILPDSEGDATVLHLDTGGGPFDQHGKGLARTSSATILATRLGVEEDPRFASLLELTRKVDNAEEISPTDIHFVIEGYRYEYRGGRLTLEELIEKSFALFDIIAEQGERAAASRAGLAKGAEWHEIGEIRLCVLNGKPQMRNAAYEAGADVTLWVSYRPGGKKYFGIQTNRRSSLDLTLVAARLRRAELDARRRGRSASRLDYEGRREDVEPCWFLHESRKLILNGSQSWEPKTDEYTRLSLKQIVKTVREALA